jgi:hypothetical protein
MTKIFETWNFRSPCHSGSLKTVSREFAEYKLHLAEYRRSNETRKAVNQQTITHSSMEMGMLIT